MLWNCNNLAIKYVIYDTNNVGWVGMGDLDLCKIEDNKNDSLSVVK